jgi:hypothetical protein
MSKADFESEVKKILPFWNLLTPELKKQLAMLTKTQQSEVAISNQKNYWPKIVVGIIFVVILCLILLSYLARNRKIIKKTKIKN